MELNIDEIFFSDEFRKSVLRNSTISVFKIYPPTKEDLEFRQPYMYGVTECENFLDPYLHELLLAMARNGKGSKAAFTIAALYIVTIFALQKWMTLRPRYELRKTLIVWNTFLAIFSILGTLRSYPEFVDIIYRSGLYGSVCNSRARFTPVHVWGWFFVFSKVAEMVDTVFIVLRKQKLIFLHWYHHAVTMVYVWHFTVLDACSPGRWFMLMNFAVHSFMYSYYALRLSRLLRIPRIVNISITSAQILQMFLGLGVASWAWLIKHTGGRCHITYVNLVCCNAMYLSYVLLFANYFYNAYIRQPRPEQALPGKEGGIRDTKCSHCDATPNQKGSQHVTKDETRLQRSTMEGDNVVKRRN